MAIISIGKTEEIFDDYRYSNYPEVIVEDLGVKIHQDFRIGKGGILWDCSYIMSKFLQTLELTNKSLIELGAGTGMSSILACSKGASVTSTDLSSVLPLLTKNFEANQDLLTGSFEIQELDLKAEITNEKKFDYVICSDLLYDPVITI